MVYLFLRVNKATTKNLVITSVISTTPTTNPQNIGIGDGQNFPYRSDSNSNCRIRVAFEHKMLPRQKAWLWFENMDTQLGVQQDRDGPAPTVFRPWTKNKQTKKQTLVPLTGIPEASFMKRFCLNVKHNPASNLLLDNNHGPPSAIVAIFLYKVTSGKKIWQHFHKCSRESTTSQRARYLSRPLGIEENVGLSVAHFLHAANLQLRVITVDPETWGRRGWN